MNKPIVPALMAIKILPAKIPDTLPTPLPPAPAKPVVDKKTVAKARPVVTPVPKPTAPSVMPRPQVAQEVKVPDASFEPRPTPSSTSAQPAPAPVAAPPVETGVSISASYAAGNRKPKYPARSLQYEEEGTVTLRVFVKADGTAGTVEIKSSSGYALLDESAKAAIETWRFNPATSDGKPVSKWYIVPYVFKLQN